ncbi:MAG TPA: hypothetical protein VNN19_08560 [bacterium]|nr:hypothetical protein [bacterium]
MTALHLAPLASALIVAVFAALVFRRYAARGGLHFLCWGVGLSLFGAASLAEALAPALWHPLVFRVWYLAGAVLSAAWIGQGTLYLLAGVRLPTVLAALVLGYGGAAALFGALARWGLTGPILVVLIALCGAIFAGLLYRLVLRRWDPRRLAGALTVLLAAASLLAAAVLLATPVDASRFDPRQPLSVQYRALLPPGAAVRRLTPAFNIYGTVALVGGAVYSAWLMRRQALPARRVVGNGLIAAGALAIAFASTLTRLGVADALYLGQVVAAGLMFGGFLLASSRTEGRRTEGASQ